MGSVLPLGLFVSAQSQPRLVYQRGRLQCLSGSLTGHFLRRQLAQFLINQRQNRIGAGRLLFAHTAKIIPSRLSIEVEMTLHASGKEELRKREICSLFCEYEKFRYHS